MNMKYKKFWTRFFRYDVNNVGVMYLLKKLGGGGCGL